MATDVPPTECGVCNETFDEAARCPRILECFHYLCTDCVHQIIKNEKQVCPFCRKKFCAETAADVRINVGVLELVRYISGLNVGQPEPLPESQSKSKDVIHDFKRESSETCSQLLMDCIEAQHQIEHMISETNAVKEVIHQKNYTIQTKVLPKIKGMISKNKKKTEALDRICKTQQTQLKEVKSKHAQLQEVKGKLDASNTLKDAAATVLQAEETNTAVNKWVESFEEQAFTDEEVLTSTRKEAKFKSEKVAKVLDVLEATESADCQSGGIASSAILGNMTWSITTDDLVNMSNLVKRLVEKGKLFAVQKQLRKRRVARITISGGKLLLHHLQEGQRLLNVLKLDHKDVMSLVDYESRIVFLELAVHGLTLGKVFIRLSPDSQRADLFAMMCTGELGFSYANTKFLEVGFKANEWEFVKAGDYELDNGMGGKLLLTTPIIEKLSHRPWTAGVVEAVWGRGDDVAAQFVIRTRSNPGYVCPVAYGIVEEGLDVLRTAIRCYDDIRDVKIKDCGIVLSSVLDQTKESDSKDKSPEIKEEIGKNVLNKCC